MPTPTPTPVPTPTPAPIALNGTASLTINWPSATAAVGTLSTAGSVGVAVTRTDTGAVVAQQVIARPIANLVSAVTLTGLPQIPLIAVVSAYLQPDGSGISMAVGGTLMVLSNTVSTAVVSFDLGGIIDHLSAAASPAQVAVNGSGSMIATAYDSAGGIVLLPPQTLAPTSSNPSVAVVGNLQFPLPYSAGTGGKTTFTVTDSSSGKSANTVLKVGYPYSVTVNAAGTRGSIPFLTDQTDDTPQLEALNGSTFNWQIYYPLANSPVSSRGAVVSLQAPATYGDREFSSWTLDGSLGSTSPTLTLDPKVGTPTQVVANYVTRLPAADGSFAPNYFGQIDNAVGTLNHPVQWDRSSPVKVSFMTTDGYTNARKQLALAGFQFWTSATNGIVQFTILPDNDSADADVIIGFTTPDAPNPGPATYIPNGSYSSPLTSLSTILGQTFWLADASNVGSGKRVLLIYYKRILSDATMTTIAAHEMGHALGSSGHSNDTRSLMYYQAQSTTVPVNNASYVFLSNGYPWEEDLNMVLTLYQQGGYDVSTRSIRKRIKPALNHGKLQSYAVP